MIPIKNLWNMLQYAWGVLEHEKPDHVPVGNAEHPIDLLGFALVRTVEPIVKKGLDRIYLPETMAMPTVRGSIDFQETAATAALTRRELVCRSESLSADFDHNRIIKASLKLLLGRQIAHSIRMEAMALLRRFAQIDDVRLTAELFRKVHLHRNNRQYTVPISICRMLFEDLRIVDEGKSQSFDAYVRDEVRMRRVFELFVRNFLRQRLEPICKVGGRRIAWANLSGQALVLSHLPTMQMDVVVEKGDRALVIDTKYTDRSLIERWSMERFRPEHLYQMFAYVENFSRQRNNLRVSGMLLYPSINEEWSEQFIIDGHDYKVATLSLELEWENIEKRLLYLCSLP